MSPPPGNCATVLVITVLIVTYAVGQQAFLKYVQRQMSAFVFNENLACCSNNLIISRSNAIAPID